MTGTFDPMAIFNEQIQLGSTGGGKIHQPEPDFLDELALHAETNPITRQQAALLAKHNLLPEHLKRGGRRQPKQRQAMPPPEQIDTSELFTDDVHPMDGPHSDVDTGGGYMTASPKRVEELENQVAFYRAKLELAESMLSKDAKAKLETEWLKKVVEAAGDDLAIVAGKGFNTPKEPKNKEEE